MRVPCRCVPLRVAVQRSLRLAAGRARRREVPSPRPDPGVVRVMCVRGTSESHQQ